MTTWRQVEVVKRTIRLEFPAPLDRKTLGIAAAMTAREFEKHHGRPPEYDNDFWLEPSDDEIAFCFDVVQKTAALAAEGADHD